MEVLLLPVILLPQDHFFHLRGFLLMGVDTLIGLEEVEEDIEEEVKGEEKKIKELDTMISKKLIQVSMNFYRLDVWTDHMINNCKSCDYS